MTGATRGSLDGFVDLSRRHLLRAGAATGLAAAAVAGAGQRLPGAVAAAPTASSAATLGSRLVPGAPGRGGYRPVVRVAGEAHRLRTDLGVTPDPGHHGRHKPLAAFVQLSDVHVVDAQSPLRVEYLDRLDDPSALPGTGLLSSSYRAHEMLSGQIADSMVRQLNDIGVGPVTGKPLALAIQTGDNSDNSQFNEVRWNIDVLGGGTVRFDSGDLTRWEGVADSHPVHYDPAYWHPEGTPRGRPDDLPRRRYGFPTVPGLLDAARRPFEAEGLGMEWFSVFGNHDGLVQGNFPQNLHLGAIATGPLKVISPVGLHPGALLDDVLAGTSDLLGGLGGTGGLLGNLALSPGVRRVTPDADRRLLTRAEVVEEHFATGGQPVGHGFTATNRAEGTAHYTVDRSGIRFVVLDTVNPNGYADGSIDADQFAWLAGVLADAGDRPVVVASHHTSETMNNPLVLTGGDAQQRVTGDAVLELLLAHAQVIAWLNGHTHANKVTARRRASGGGLWEITTASHIDWPQQSRLLEVADNRDGTLSIFTTMVDHAGPAATGGSGALADAAGLAGLGRELALNDWHDHSGGTGTRADRNVELVVADPRS
ncbi:TIGR03767 family metallophosphoesterase [Nocardioides panacisoli]|uniref:TIGR03767 family metallophosphoesterase n=1 Tax=Nocardioides panacisoli TaxID=627624 RepID=UPI001C624B2B|nr:TIGR03767 family metallophosphoesterase [Nocardioides panacisoli]QYJ03227.1 TIGR03767 family metallophosphoesterase [Nocardioides panacisoli]